MKRAALLVLVVAAGLLTGCSSFNRQWRAALQTPPPANDITGPWEGTWKSDVNGHNGRLRCVITKTGEGAYDANFHAKYKKILGFGYTVPLKARYTGESWRFEGEADLGKLAGGLYNYSGAATPFKFFSTYDSEHDHGKFEMTRPKTQKP